MTTLLIATHNQAKLREIKQGVHSFIKDKVKILSLNNINVKTSPDESGKTFEENSRLKAKFYGDLTGLPTIADDGGLIIPALNNEPGVKSRRWLGYEATDGELIEYTFKRLEGFPRKKRVAYLATCLCFYLPSKDIFICGQEKTKGYIATKPTKNYTPGYPFRALFIVERFNKYYDELTEEEHRKENHRLRALKRLVKRIEKYLIE